MSTSKEFEIIYLPAHENCTLKEDGTGDCFCIRRGFTSIEMAAIFAYHHLACSICKKERAMFQNVSHLSWEDAAKRLQLDKTEPELLGFYEDSFELYKSGSIVDRWFDCACSAEWDIQEVE